MYTCNPKHLYALNWAIEDPRNVARLERPVRGLGRELSSVEVLRADQLPEVIRANGWIGEVRQGAYAIPHDPDFVFSAFTWAAPEERAALAREELFRRCIGAHTSYGDCKQNTELPPIVWATYRPG